MKKNSFIDFLSLAFLKIWFQNRRVKYKKEGSMTSCEKKCSVKVLRTCQTVQQKRIQSICKEENDDFDSP